MSRAFRFGQIVQKMFCFPRKSSRKLCLNHHSICRIVVLLFPTVADFTSSILLKEYESVTFCKFGRKCLFKIPFLSSPRCCTIWYWFDRSFNQNFSDVTRQKFSYCSTLDDFNLVERLVGPKSPTYSQRK